MLIAVRIVSVAMVWLVGLAGAQQRELQLAVSSAELKGVRVGIAICDDQGKVLYRRQAAGQFVPASNMKLLTTMAVINGLGADYRFCTRFLLEDGVLVVEAGGDPNGLRDSEHAPERVFADVARALRARGAATIRGIELRPGTFVGPLRPDSWPQNQLHAYYCAPTGGFVLQQGTFVLGLDPGGGADADVRLLAPPAGLPIQGSVRVIGSSKGEVYGAIDMTTSIKVRGKIWRKSPGVEIRTAVNDPSAWYLATLRTVLQAGGVALDATAAAAAPDGLVHEHRSPLEPALRRTLVDSSNFDAEQCLRVLAAETRQDGSLAGARAALSEQLTRLVQRIPEGSVFADGSGLSKDNRVSPGLLVVAMFRVAQSEAGKVMFDWLPVAGRDGTMKRRFVGSDLVGKVRAKTGWVAGASSLSGLVEMPAGGVRWFSILMNYDPKRGGLNKDLKKIQERIVAAAVGLESE